MTNRLTDEQTREACVAWGRCLSHPSKPGDFSSLYAEDGRHADHCHYYKQTGKHELEILHKVWLNSIPDCMIKLEKFDLLENASDGNRRAHIWYTGSGTFARDLMDTKATGKEVKYLGAVDFLFDDKGKIVSSDEWMSNIFYKLPPLDYRYYSLGHNRLEGSGPCKKFVVDTTGQYCNCRWTVGLGPVFCSPRGDSRLNAPILASRESTFLFPKSDYRRYRGGRVGDVVITL